MKKFAKSGPLTKTDLGFLGYVEVQTERGSDLPQDRFRVYSANTRAGIARVKHFFVYLLGSCREKEVELVAQAVASGKLSGGSQIFVVYPKSISNLRAWKSESLRGKIYVYEDLMWERLESVFNDYMSTLSGRVAEICTGMNYIHPDVFGRCENFVSGKDSHEQNIIVLRAHAGVGKSALAAQIAKRLVENWRKMRVIPLLLIGRAAWKNLAQQADDRTDMWGVLSLALKLEGNEFPVKEEEFFRNFLRQGYVSFIFDGFDELELPGSSPKENLEWLMDIARDSSARIIVTARSSFWDREIVDVNLHLLELHPFDKDMAYKYFNERLCDKESDGRLLAAEAKHFYKKLVESSDNGEDDLNFFRLPSCIGMIAEYVESGGDVPSVDGDNKRMVRDFFMTILERERIRQKIDTPRRVMHNAFEQISIAMDEFELDDILCLDLPDKYEISSADIARMKDHAFITEFKPSKYKFKHEFLAYYLKASYVSDMLCRGDIVAQYRSKDRAFRDLIDGECYGRGQLPEKVADFLRSDDLMSVADAHKQADKKLKSFLIHVLIETVRLRERSADASDVSNIVFDLLGADMKRKIVSNLCVYGQIGGISLCEWTIQNSKFAYFSMGVASIKGSPPNFVECYFEGAPDIVPHQRRFERCKGDKDAQLVLAGDEQEISDYDLEDYLKTVLNRFGGYSDRANVRTINDAEWKTGKTKSIEERFGLLDAMKKAGLVERIDTRAKIKISPSAIGDLRNFMENGRVEGKIKKVIEHMKKQLV